MGFGGDPGRWRRDFGRTVVCLLCERILWNVVTVTILRRIRSGEHSHVVLGFLAERGTKLVVELGMPAYDCEHSIATGDVVTIVQNKLY